MTQRHQKKSLNLAYYCRSFSALNVSSNRQRGEARYKPILLLSVIDLIAQEKIIENMIFVSDDLIETFNTYWAVLGSDSYKGGLHYPFLYLQSEGFWHIELKVGFKGLQPKTTKKLREAVEYAYFDDALFDLLQDTFSRQALIDTLVSVWFSASRKELEEILTVNQAFQNATQSDLETPTQPKFVLRKSAVRNAFFRKAVVHIYDYRCIFCKLRVMRSINQNIVDGAHIIPFSEFYDNKINNGLSLCKNHHWAFDQGWFTIDDDYKIVVASDLEEDSPNVKPMKDFNQESILLPNSEEHFPSLQGLQWHRLNVFKES